LNFLADAIIGQEAQQCFHIFISVGVKLVWERCEPRCGSFYILN